MEVNELYNLECLKKGNPVRNVYLQIVKYSQKSIYFKKELHKKAQYVVLWRRNMRHLCCVIFQRKEPFDSIRRNDTLAGRKERFFYEAE